MKFVLIFLKWIVIAVISLVLAFYAISASLYRLSLSSEVVSITDEIVYKFIELDFSSRNIFEESIGNRKVRLKNGSVLYISSSDMERLWKINPHDMAKKNINYIVTFETRNLVFGGYGKAKITSIEEVAGKPNIRK